VEEENMDHQAFAQLLGNHGDFVGAIAVVVTLIYIAMQVSYGRQEIEINRHAVEENTRVQKASSLDSYNNALSRFRSHIINSDDVTENLDWRQSGATHGRNGSRAIYGAINGAHYHDARRLW
jgi:hypothetical protein